MQEREKKMWLLDSNREGSRGPVLRWVPSFLTAELHKAVPRLGSRPSPTHSDDNYLGFRGIGAPKLSLR